MLARVIAETDYNGCVARRAGWLAFDLPTT